jgi:type IV pilus assembly protein PilA
MRTTKGLTLIELLVVIAIIAILMAVALPNLANARSSALDSAMVGYATNTATLVQIYLLDRNRSYTDLIGASCDAIPGQPNPRTRGVAACEIFDDGGGELGIRVTGDTSSTAEISATGLDYSRNW